MHFKQITHKMVKITAKVEFLTDSRSVCLDKINLNGINT